MLGGMPKRSLVDLHVKGCKYPPVHCALVLGTEVPAEHYLTAFLCQLHGQKSAGGDKNSKLRLEPQLLLGR